MWQITLTISVVTLDGHGTFHGIRIIAGLQRATVNEIAKDKGLATIQYIGPAEKAQL